ncbi:hypothetical protein Nepgr_022935 [Nepenthes gracilis]|uniref:Uncharacterized protein n=1 Tax=Nepenthes gracilis TaxID=150966 RepID=A0AAD3SZX3_NEPGR|nr:hypothetical protein Nepgr_022935 [Nepenthes gracilis]
MPSKCRQCLWFGHVEAKCSTVKRNSAAGNPLSKIALPKCRSKPASRLVDLPSEVKCPALAEEVSAAAVSSPMQVNAAKDMTPAPVSLAEVSKPQHVSSSLPLNSGSVVNGIVLNEVDVKRRPVSAPFSTGVEKFSTLLDLSGRAVGTEAGSPLSLLVGCVGECSSPDSELGIGPLADDPADAPGSSFDESVDPVEADTGPGDVKFDEVSYSKSSLQTPVLVPAVIPEVVYVMKPSCVDDDLAVSSHAHRASGPSAEIDPEFTPDSISRIVRKHCLIQSDPDGCITPTLEANRPACSDVDSAVTMPPNESGHDPALPIVYPDYGAEDPTAVTRAFSAAFKYHLKMLLLVSELVHSAFGPCRATVSSRVWIPVAGRWMMNLRSCLSCSPNAFPVA